MEANQMELFGALAMAGVTFPLSFYLARLCLKGVVWMVTGEGFRSIEK